MQSYKILEAGIEGNNQFLVLFVLGQHNFQGKRIRIGGKTVNGLYNADTGTGSIIGLPPIPGWYPVLNQVYIRVNNGQIYTAIAIRYPGVAPTNGQFEIGNGQMTTNASGFWGNRMMDSTEIYKPIFSTQKTFILPFNLNSSAQKIFTAKTNR